MNKKKKLITTWVNKSNSKNWLAYADKMDCRNKEGFEKVSYIGQVTNVNGEYTTFECINAFGSVIINRVLSINIDSIKDYES